MQIKKYIASVIALSAFIAIVSYFSIQNRQAIQRLPDISKRSGEVTASSELLNIQKAAEFYRYEIRQNPDIAKNYVQLAQLYLHQARITGRHHQYVAKAQKLLDEARSREPENFETIMTEALVMLTLHRFEEARELANRAIAKNSFSAFSWGVLSDALKELGDYEGAVKACDKMLSIRPDLRSYSRAAHLREVHGDIAGARQAMKLACDAGVIGLETRAWTLYQLGNLHLKEGKLDTAEYIYKGILEERADYPYALSGLAQIRSANKDYKNAIQFMLQAYEIFPEHEFMEMIIEIYRASGQTKRVENLAVTVLEGFKQHEDQGWNVNLEYAGFCANHDIYLDQALTRIETEYRRRPNNLDVLETYAWVLYKNARAQEAVPIIKKALQINKRDALLNYRAGMIASKLGEHKQAKDYLETALSINPSLTVAEIKIARGALVELADKLQFASLDNR